MILLLNIFSHLSLVVFTFIVFFYPESFHLYILRSSSIGGYPYVQQSFRKTPSVVVEIFHLRSSSIEGCLHFKQFSILILSPQLKFKIWRRPNQRLLRCSNCWGHLPQKCVFHWRSSSFQPKFDICLVPTA